MRGIRRVGRVLEPIFLSSAELVGYLPYSSHGHTLHYRVENAHHLPRGISPGVLFYFDGDYLLNSGSRLLRRTSTLRSQLAQLALEYRMLLVPVLAPGTISEGVLPEPTTNWWVRARKNCRLFLDFAQDIRERYDYDTRRVWLAGYSGGAEFITYELLLHSRGLLRGGGASLIGGGGADGIRARDRIGAGYGLDRLLLSWHVGDRDGSTPPLWGRRRSSHIWSAQVAAIGGGQFYTARGARTNLHIIPGQGHRNYPIRDLVHADLAMGTRLGYL